MIDVSALDIAPVWSGDGVADAIRRVGDLAAAVEDWGYARFWIGEHHNTPALAAAATPVLVAHAAGRTRVMRVGSGGVLLPNHPPLVVAEQFATLEALHPGRIDLGVGRASGADPLTASMLGHPSTGDDLAFLRRLLRPLTADPLIATPALAGAPPV